MLLAVIVVGLVATFGMNFGVLIPAFARTTSLIGAAGYGFLMAASGIGSLLAACGGVRWPAAPVRLATGDDPRAGVVALAVHAVLSVALG